MPKFSDLRFGKTKAIAVGNETFCESIENVGFCFNETSHVKTFLKDARAKDY